MSIALLALPGAAAAVDAAYIADENGCRFINPAPKPDETIAWTGACRDGWGDGPGTLQWTAGGAPGARFVGTLAHGRPDGHGVFTWTNGSRYEGMFLAGRRPGPGVFTTAAGLRYEARFEHEDMSGHGVVSLADGTRLAGTFRLGLLDGAGVFVRVRPSGEQRLPVETDESLLPGVPPLSASAPGAPHADIGRRCQPSYPQVALDQHATGFTKMALLVDPSGQVQRIRMIHPSGADLAHQSLDLAALVAVADCPIVPGALDGRPATRWLSLTFAWRLE